ncbi:hypothetical protein SHT65_06680 [Enterococcus faecalis]|uniref:hypothetical protein n=1 Tax=Enterococcus TaxID=1350 RepID=UPI0009C16A11|nr:hypothetical protein [Enterococcus faecalis]EMC2392154.1 hypothetical protein [Enterococcus faecalis]MBC2827788.1 hypothetical protein [Enterococcus faecalis]MBW9283019.1 hypothetical protein [Enterococcus faecalis]MBX8940578.1 hypothetical protein [Enterococcus faecalis]OQO75373.1 hypothetical protein BH746_01330 [Enterococcus faecalis]
MVQIKSIFKNFIPTNYKKYSLKEYTNKSFLLSGSGYIFLLLFWLLGRWSGRSSGTITDETNQFILNFLKIIMQLLILDVVCLMLFKIKKLQKYLAVFIYALGMLFLIILCAFTASLSDNTTNVFIWELILVFSCLFLQVVYNFVLTFISLKKNNLSIRDKYANYCMNFIGIFGLLILLLAKILDNSSLFFIGFSITISILMNIGIFHFPRVIRYWKKIPSIDLNKSAYGNSIEMMKNKENKKQ